jgi:hypothetical protein
MMEQIEKSRRWFSGYSLGITGGGQFCPLEMTAGYEIPYNWE